MLALSKEAIELRSQIKAVRNQLEQCGSGAVVTPSMGMAILDILDVINTRLTKIETAARR